MNRKQFVCMWLGIVAVVLCGVGTVIDTYRADYLYFGVCVFLVALVTGGLIVTFRDNLIVTFNDKKKPEGEERKPMNRRRGLRRITLLLAVVSGIAGAFGAVVMVQHQQHYEENYIQWKWGNFKDKWGVTSHAGFETKESEKPKVDIGKFRETYPEYDDLSDADLQSRLNSKYSEEKAELARLEEGFWVNLSTTGLVIGSLGGAVLGFVAVWLVLFVAWLFYQLYKWLALGFRLDAR